MSLKRIKQKHMAVILRNQRTCEERAKPKFRDWRWWQCGLCLNWFATRPHQGETDDGSTPNCCPYCGQIFHHHNEFIA